LFWPGFQLRNHYRVAPEVLIGDPVAFVIMFSLRYKKEAFKIQFLPAAIKPTLY